MSTPGAAHFTCPYCGEERSSVKDSRKLVRVGGRRRRRLCIGCGRRFTTYEVVSDDPEGLARMGALQRKLQRLSGSHLALVMDLIEALPAAKPYPEPSPGLPLLDSSKQEEEATA